MIDVPQYLHGRAGVVRCGQRLEKALPTEGAVLYLSRLEKAHDALGMIPELAKPFPLEPVCARREKIEDLPVGHARGDKGLRVLPACKRRGKRDERLDALAFGSGQPYIRNCLLSLASRRDHVANEGAGNRLGLPSLPRERSNQTFRYEDLQCSPDPGAPKAISGFDLYFRECRSRGDFAGQDGMAKHLESHRTFGGWPRGLRRREGRGPIIHAPRSARFVTSHKVLCDISQG
ncbi:hypothetical protein U0023_25570 (plasmid) [Microvirga lotononidis]|nr:hypothetical protein U0023_25570 [Microvirga lotononidis]